MKTLASSAFAAVVAAACSSLAQAQPAISAAVISEDRFPVQKSTFPGGVTALPDVVYAHATGYRALRLDLYLPSRTPSGAPKPFVFYVHGGGWSGGSPRNAGAFEDRPGVLASLAAKGYVVASVDYRLSGEAKFPAAEQDVKAAIRWLRSKASTYGVDPTRGIVWGGSAGGHLAALAATSCGVAEFEPQASGRGGRSGRGAAAAAPPQTPELSDCVQGLVSWYGIFDFAPLVSQNSQGGPSGFLGCTSAGCPADAVRLASPVSFVSAQTPPALLIHGTADTTVNPKQSQDFYDLLKSKGVQVELMMIPGVGHSFIGQTPEATRSASIAAIDRTFAFIDATIGPKSKSR